jgi:mannose-6-phosphate isomerase
MKYQLYPLKFETQFYEKIWGGQKINLIFNKNFGKLINCGETWELSGVKNKESIVANGFLKGEKLNNIIKKYKNLLLGEKTYNKFGNEFPLLIKFIDANEDLSVQVHPNDELAMKRHLCHGKNEMWYIINADKEAKLISGFNTEIDKQTYLDKLNDNKLLDILNFEKVKTGDVFFIPAGRIHAIGKGIFLAEIQQTSDITYRIYDWGRTDKNGEQRILHTKEALEAIDFKYYKNYKTKYKIIQNTSSEILKTKYFSTNIISLTQKIQKDYSIFDSFIIYICIEGYFELIYESNTMSLKAGDVVLLPSEIKKYQLSPLQNSKIIEVYL